LTLKALQEELEKLKKSKISSSKSHESNSIGHDIKDSFIQRLYMKSGAFSMFLITGILGYANKIPIIRKLIFLLSLWFGKTTIWKIIVKLRKLFVIFNAIIGVYVIFKSVGFSSDNVLVGFTAIGHTYLEMLMKFTKGLFNWFFELFDYKIIPSVPTDTPKGPIWNPVQSHDPWRQKVLDLSSINKFPGFNIFNVEVTPWYKDWSTWMYIAGGICAIGTLYLGYKVVMDPSILIDWFKSKTVETGAAATPPLDPGPSTGPGTIAAAAVNQVDPSTNQSIISKVVNVYHKTVYRLNPINWIAPSHETQRKFQEFLGTQFSMTHANDNFYPFTDNNPYDSWLKRLRVRWLGETSAELLERNRLIRIAHHEYEQIRVKPESLVSAGSKVATAANSPILQSLGISLPLPEGLTSGERIWSTTSSKAGSPSIATVGLPLEESPINPITTFTKPTTSTVIQLSKVPPTPDVIGTGDAWIKNSPKSGSMLSRAAEMAQRREAWSQDNSTIVGELDATPTNVTPVVENLNVIPVESSVD
jgi:hypothetical protein